MSGDEWYLVVMSGDEWHLENSDEVTAITRELTLWDALTSSEGRQRRRRAESARGAQKADRRTCDQVGSHGAQLGVPCSGAQKADRPHLCALLDKM